MLDSASLKRHVNRPYESPGKWVFRIDGKTKKVSVIYKGFDMPNGIAFSPDESRVYIADTVWFIHYYEDGRDELYQLSKDIGEQNDLAAKHPEIARTMRTQLNTWLKKTGARTPAPNPRFDPEKRKLQDANTRSKYQPRLEKQHAHFLDPAFTPNKDWWGLKTTKD
jgi:hypothetical protein